MSDVRVVSGAPIKSGTYERSPISPCRFFLPYFYPGDRNAHLQPLSAGLFPFVYDPPGKYFFPPYAQISGTIGEMVDIFSTPVQLLFLPTLTRLPTPDPQVKPSLILTSPRKRLSRGQGDDLRYRAALPARSIPSFGACLSHWPNAPTKPRGPVVKRRIACLKVLEAFLRHLDEDSLCIGHSSPESDFIALDMKSIARETGLNRKRCERAITLLKNMGFIEVRQPQYGHNPAKYAGLRAVRAITPALIEWLRAVGQSESQPEKSDTIASRGGHESD